MKHYLTTLTFFITTVIIAQGTISKTVGEFSTLKAYDLINIELVKSDENRVEIRGKNAEDVVVVNKNGKLKIRMNLDEIFDGADTQITLYYTSVDVIDANEGAYISSKDKIKQYELILNAQEGGKINLGINVKEAELRAVTGGIIELSGKTNNQKISIGTGGVFNGKEFKSTTTSVAIRAGGEAEVYAKELVDVKIRAGGDVYIYGDPNTVNESRALGGRIKRMD
jgi:hypothetical protein